jgi:hypothetical protein
MRAAVLGGGSLHVESALGALSAGGIEAVAAATMSEARALVEAGTVVLVVGEGALDECGKAMCSWPQTLRRGAVVMLVERQGGSAPSNRSFLLGVDAVVGAGEVARLGDLAGRAAAAKRQLVAAIDSGAAARFGASP